MLVRVNLQQARSLAFVRLCDLSITAIVEHETVIDHFNYHCPKSQRGLLASRACHRLRDRQCPCSNRTRSFANRDQAARFQAEVASRIRERRASAIRINALTEPTLLETFANLRSRIDFANLPTTAALVIEGQADRTTFQPPATPGTQGTWNFVYHGRQLQIPAGWRIANSASELSPLPLIPLGVPTTSFSFDADGQLDADSLPPTSSNTNPNAESPFPTIYLTNGNEGRAVAVHPSGTPGALAIRRSQPSLDRLFKQDRY